MAISKIAVVGGGTAGWLAANHLGLAFKDLEELSVTLIESKDIPPIGVGEGTVPNIRKTLEKFGISETDFIRECDVTFKQSIKFANWMDKGTHGEHNFYHHLFDAPNPLGVDMTAYWQQVCPDKPYADVASFQHDVCEKGLAPKTITTPEYQSDLSYAYHLNAAKFAKLLSKNAQEKFDVQHLLANISSATNHPDGSIKALITDEGKALNFDFYIDCTGFESLLIDKNLAVPFIEKSEQLLVNSALVVQVPTDGKCDIPPYTIATAHQAGWIWDIALPNRRGVGFVYSDNHLTDDEAKEKLNRYLGGNLDDLPWRKIPMKVGHRQKFWHKNCVALGLAQGFLEPLEATSILLTDFAASFLANRFPKQATEMEALEKRFNQVMQYAWERVIDFVKLHYLLSDRSDSQFWLDNQKVQTIPESLQEKLAIWKGAQPLRDDFFSKFEVFDLENYLYVLYGMNFNSPSAPTSESDLARVKATENKMSEIKQQLASNLPKHRELIEKIHKYGLQKT